MVAATCRSSNGRSPGPAVHTTSSTRQPSPAATGLASAVPCARVRAFRARASASGSRTDVTEGGTAKTRLLSPPDRPRATPPAGGPAPTAFARMGHEHADHPLRLAEERPHD